MVHKSNRPTVHDIRAIKVDLMRIRRAKSTASSISRPLAKTTGSTKLRRNPVA